MNYSLLSVSTPPAINIGDYIQALAARQFLPHVDSYIERELLRDYSGVNTSVIMNGYYMHDGSQWPPSNRINPLYVAVHISSLVKDQMLSDEGVRYFKKHEPIGCRDLDTVKVLSEHGVKAYFSGCMTLTLGMNYKNEYKDGKVYFVDVQIPTKGRLEQLMLLFHSLFCFKSVRSIAVKMPYTTNRLRSLFGIWCKAAKFYFSFRGLIDPSLLNNAIFLTQEDKVYNKLPNNDARIDAAESLVKKYSQASLVITSRIHCALPCLAVETPVYFVYDDNMPLHSKKRLNGLVQLFNVIHWTGKDLRSSFVSKSNIITKESIIPNKRDYLEYANKLTERCISFVNSCENRSL